MSSWEGKKHKNLCFSDWRRKENYSYIGPRQADVKKKELAKILKCTGIDITIEANLKLTNSLGLTFDLNIGTYKTYNKPNNTPLICTQANQSPS